MDFSAQDSFYHLFNGLVIYDDEGKLEPHLAESWEISSDATSITFNLREDVKWHDSEPFNSDDVLFTMETINGGDISNRFKPQLTIEGTPIAWSAPNESTVLMEAPHLIAPIMATLSELKILPEHALGGQSGLQIEAFNSNPIGTGAFKFTGIEESSTVKTEAIPDYHLGQPKLGGIDHVYIAEQDTAVAAMLANQIDVIWTFPQNLPSFEGTDKVVHKYAFHQAITLAFNLENEMFADKRVREAFRYAIKSKEQLANVATQGQGEAANAFFAYASPLATYNPPEGLESRVNDQQRAAQLLDEAGWALESDGFREKDGQKLSAEILTDDFFTEYTDSVQILQAWMREVGIDLIPKPVNFELLDELKLNSRSNPENYALELGDLPGTTSELEPDMIESLSCDARPENGRNFINICNNRIDELLKQGRTTFDLSQRQSAYREIQQILHDETAIVPLYFVFDALVYTPRMHGIPQDSPASRYYYRTFPERIWLDEQ